MSMIKKSTTRDFPSGPVVKNLPANAGEGGFDPWSGKNPTCFRVTKQVCCNHLPAL